MQSTQTPPCIGATAPCIFWQLRSEGVNTLFAYLRTGSCRYPSVRGWSCGNCLAGGRGELEDLA